MADTPEQVVDGLRVQVKALNDAEPKGIPPWKTGPAIAMNIAITTIKSLQADNAAKDERIAELTKLVEDAMESGPDDEFLSDWDKVARRVLARLSTTRTKGD